MTSAKNTDRTVEPFINRTDELRRLHDLLAHLGDAQHQHAALIGLRRIGKSFILRHLERMEPAKGRNVVRLACDAAAGDLDTWTRHYVRALIAGADETFDRDTEPTKSLLLRELRRLPSEVQVLVGRLFDELDRKKPAWDAVFEGTLTLAQRLAEASQKQVIVALDEFPSVLRLRRNRVPSLDGIVRDVLEERSPDVLFVLAGSAVRQMRDVLEGSAPLLTRVESISVGTFDGQALDELIDARLQFKSLSIDSTARQELERFVGRHPYWTVRLIERAGTLAGHDGLGPIEQVHLEQAIFDELIDPTGSIAVVCSWIYDHSLTRSAADDHHLLRALTAFPGPVRRAELAATDELKAWNRTKLGRHIDDLIRAGILVEYGTRSKAVLGVADPVFGIWLMHKAGHIAPNLEDVIEELRRVIKRQADEKSRWYESYVRTTMDEFRDMGRWPGAVFGPSAPPWLNLPTFTTFEMDPTTNPAAPDPEELDIFATGTEAWLVEVKARQVRASVKDLRRLKEKADGHREHGRPIDRLWFVALNGFSPEAEDYANANGVLITSGTQLQTLYVELQARRRRRKAKP